MNNEHINKKTIRKQNRNARNDSRQAHIRNVQSERSGDWYHDASQEAPGLRRCFDRDED